MKIRTLLRNGIYVLHEKHIEDGNLVAKMLLSNILGVRREELIFKDAEEVPKEKEEEFFAGIGKIAMGYPVQYVIGKKEFMKMDFFVNENVLIPRADTEVLVEEVLNISKGKQNILELCTGSGIIAISLAKYLEEVKIIATDISDKALEVAKHNFNNLVPDKKVDFIKSDMFENIEGKFDIIVSNPPYIKRDVIKDYNLKYEPEIALDGGADGLKFYKTIIDEGYKYLNKNGIIALEIGYDQKDEIFELVYESKKYKEVYSRKDLFGNDRVIIIQS